MLSEDENGRKINMDQYLEKEVLQKKAYLGDLILNDGTNNKNIKARTEKSYGNVEKIREAIRRRNWFLFGIFSDFSTF